MMASFASTELTRLFTNYAQITPTFFFAGSATNAANNALVEEIKAMDPVVYIDSMSFKKYPNYVDFTSIELVDEEGNSAPNRINLPHNKELYTDENGQQYYTDTTYATPLYKYTPAFDPMTFTVKAMVGEQEIDPSKLVVDKYYAVGTYGTYITNVTFGCYSYVDGGEGDTKLSDYRYGDWYKIIISSKVKSGSVKGYLQDGTNVSLTSTAMNTSGSAIVVCFKYEADDGTIYRGSIRRNITYSTIDV